MANGNHKNRKVSGNSLIFYSKQNHELKSEFNWNLARNVLKVLLPILVLIYLYHFSALFKVKDVIISGNKNIPSALIMTTIPSGDNIFSLDISKLETETIESIPEIEQIQIYRGIPNALKVIVTERQAAAIWQSGINYFLISESGDVYRDVTTDYQNYSNFPKINDLRSLAVIVPSKITSNDFIDFVEHIFQNVKTEVNIDPDYFSIDETSVDLTLYTRNGFYIKFDTLRDAKTQIENLKLILTQKRSDIHEYVDLRVNGWGYVK